MDKNHSSIVCLPPHRQSLTSTHIIVQSTFLQTHMLWHTLSLLYFQFSANCNIRNNRVSHNTIKSLLTSVSVKPTHIRFKSCKGKATVGTKWGPCKMTVTDYSVINSLYRRVLKGQQQCPRQSRWHCTPDKSIQWCSW